MSRQKNKEEVIGSLTHSFSARNHPLSNMGLNWSLAVMPPKKKPLKDNTSTGGGDKEDQLSRKGEAGAELDNVISWLRSTIASA